MSQFHVQQILEIKPFTTAHGQLYAVKMAGLLDNQITPTATINVKDPGNAPVVGSVLDVSITKQDSYGISLKKNPPAQYIAPVAVQPVYAPQQVAVQQPVAAPLVPPVLPVNPADPRQTSIERQSSLAQAVAYCSAKASALTAAKKHDEALKKLEGHHVIEVASYFNRYVMGKVNVAMNPDEVAAIFGYTLPVPEEAVLEEDPFGDIDNYMPEGE